MVKYVKRVVLIMNLIKDLDKKILSEFEKTLIPTMSESDKKTIMSYAKIASMISAITVKKVLEDLPDELKQPLLSSSEE